MGRDGFVDYMIDVARCLGLKVTVFPDTGDADILVFRHWSEMTGNEIMLKERPNLDILYGQDLCHQVPAIVRNHGEDNKSRKHPGR